MKTQKLDWQIKDLIDNSNKIEYPEFQREPTVWKLDKKQRLIDSICRDFDISSIYFYKKEGGGYDCIDGKQRINAIMSYIGLNDADTEDNMFHLQIENEIFDDPEEFVSALHNKRYDRLEKKWKERIGNYRLNIVLIEGVEFELELNLLFLRLQIASILNAGEKLHAMSGEMRDWIFRKLYKHPYFGSISVPKRRYAREQVATQIVLNIFSLRDEESYHRCRYVDMQNFFKTYNELNRSDKELTKVIIDTLTQIVNKFGDTLSYVNNRAIAVSLFLFVDFLNKSIKKEKLDNEMSEFKDFFVLFLKTLRWQIPKGIDIHRAYRDLLKFQSSVTQAAVEKTAIEKRHDMWRDYFDHYKKKKDIIGDSEYKKDTKRDPNKERDEVEL